MASKFRIKDVAEMAGVSTGTVDRVIHNRGHVSESKRAAIEKALEQANYRTNIHVSALTLKRHYRVIITIPQYSPNEYWEHFTKGADQAIRQYSGLKIDCDYVYYNQFDLFSCRKAYEEILAQKPEAVIIGPTFRDEAAYLANQLTDMDIPYLFVDSSIESTAPLAYFMTDLEACGYLMAKLITTIIGPDDDIGIMQAVRVGDESANTTIMRKAGFLRYCEEHAVPNKLVRIPYSPVSQEKNETLIGDYFLQNPQIKGVVVLNSRGYMIADYFKKHGIDHVKMIAIDMLARNIQAMKEGYIDFIIGQRPEQQGYLAIKTLFEHLVYRTAPAQTRNIMPFDVITRENVDAHVRFSQLYGIE